MKAIVFEQHGGIEQLAYTDFPDPVPEPGECMIKVEAVALNGFDPMILNKIPGLKTPLPMIPGGDVAGEIVGYGDGVDVGEWPLGTKVMVDPAMFDKGGVLGETVIGGASDFIAIPTTNLVKIPGGVSTVDAACLPIAYGTAHKMILKRGRVVAGDKVLILGASGGVGSCCIQLAKMVGAEVAACTSSAAKGEKLKELGADHIIDISKQNYVEFVRELWGKPRVFEGGGGADVIVNYNGGDSWTECFRALKREGRLLTCGATNGYDPKTDLRYIWSFEFDILGSNGWARDDLTSLLELVRDGKIIPVKDSVRPLPELGKSLQELIDRKIVGKAVLVP